MLILSSVLMVSEMFNIDTSSYLAKSSSIIYLHYILNTVARQSRDARHTVVSHIDFFTISFVAFLLFPLRFTTYKLQMYNLQYFYYYCKSTVIRL